VRLATKFEKGEKIEAVYACCEAKMGRIFDSKRMLMMEVAGGKWLSMSIIG
jgi:hypothetical protein